MSTSNHISKVAIVGVTGRIGKTFAEALVKAGKHQVTALTRADTKGPLPSGVKAVQIDYNDEQTLVSAMTGQEFLVITLSVLAPPDTHSKLVKAAIKAGVPYIMPNIYGTISPKLANEDPYTAFSIQKCEEIARLGGVWVAMCCGFWYEWSLALGEQWYGIDIKARTVTFFDDGKTPITSSTWDQCGRALVALLSLAESGASPSVSDWKNRGLDFDSFTVTQRDMLDSLHRVLGTKDEDWKIRHEETKKRFQDGQEEMKQGIRTGFAKCLYTRRFFPDRAGLTPPEKLANELLGLPKESLDEATKRAVDMVESGWTPF